MKYFDHIFKYLKALDILHYSSRIDGNTEEVHKNRFLYTTFTITRPIKYKDKVIITIKIKHSTLFKASFLN